MISVIVPVYNEEAFLQYCIDSLLAQTYKDLEILFVNDASTDNSLSILHKNQNRDSNRIRVLNLKEHVNLGEVRNIGLKEARGEYVGFVDSDDMIAPDMYELLYNAIQKDNADVAYIMHATVGENVDYHMAMSSIGYAEPRFEWNQRLIDLEGHDLSDKERSYLHIYPIGGIWAGLWRKSLILQNEVWWPKLRYEDNYWASLMFCYIRRIAFVNSIQYFYRDNPNSITHKRNQIYTLDRIDIEEKLLRDVKRRHLFEKYYISWEYIYVRRYVLNTFFVLMKNWDKIPIEQLRNISRSAKKEFPRWYENQYCRQFKINKKILVFSFMYAPVLTAVMYKILYKIYKKCQIKRSN